MVAHIELKGVDAVLKELRGLDREIKNEARREMRQSLDGVVKNMRKEAPELHAKLDSSIKKSVSGNLGASVKWGGKSGKRAINRFLKRYGQPGAHGGTWATPGRISEAFYVLMVAKGHPTPRGPAVPANKWMYKAVRKSVGKLEKEMLERLRKIADRHSRA